MMSGRLVSSGLLYSRPVPHLPVPMVTTLLTLLWCGSVRVVTTLPPDLGLVIRVVRVSPPVFIPRAPSCSGDMFPLYTVSSVVHSLTVKGEGWRHMASTRPYQLLSHSCNSLSYILRLNTKVQSG